MTTPDPRATLHAIWRTRPSRRESDRKFAGVAAAIARRYDLDPVLARIALVVAAFYGVGVLLYLAAWVTLPPDPADAPTGPLVRGGGAVHPIVAVAAVVAGLIGMNSLLRGDPGVLVGIAVFGGLLYLLHQSRGERGLGSGQSVGQPPGEAAGPWAATSAVGSTEVGSAAVGSAAVGSAAAASSATGDAAAGADQRMPPAWDPLGAAPFAWDLPEPAPASAGEASRRRSVLTTATLGLALLAGGVTGALTLADQGLGGVRPIFGVMLAVIGLGLLVGAFRHTGRGLIALAIPLLLLSAAAAAAPVRHWHGVGDLRAAPTTLAELAPGYRRSIGDVKLDLRQLDFTGRGEIAVPGTPGSTAVAAPGPAAPPAQPSTPPLAGAAPAGSAPPTVPGAPTAPANPEPVRASVSLGLGDATVLLPPNVPVRLHCHADLGEVNCLGGGAAPRGPGADVVVVDPGVNVAPGTRPLQLDVTVRNGDAVVRRG